MDEQIFREIAQEAERVEWWAEGCFYGINAIDVNRDHTLAKLAKLRASYAKLASLMAQFELDQIKAMQRAYEDEDMGDF